MTEGLLVCAGERLGISQVYRPGFKPLAWGCADEGSVGSGFVKKLVV